MKSTLVLYRRGLCVFSIFGICPGRKVMWKKVLRVLQTRWSTILEGLKEQGYVEGMKEAKQGTYLLGSRLQHLTVSKHRSYAMLSSGKILPNVWSYSRTGPIQGLVLFKDYIMQTKVNKPQELNCLSR